MTPSEAAERAGVTWGTIDNAIRAGSLIATRPGKEREVDEASFRAWIALRGGRRRCAREGCPVVLGPTNQTGLCCEHGRTQIVRKSRNGRKA